MACRGADVLDALLASLATGTAHLMHCGLPGLMVSICDVFSMILGPGDMVVVLPLSRSCIAFFFVAILDR